MDRLVCPSQSGGIDLMKGVEYLPKINPKKGCDKFVVSGFRFFSKDYFSHSSLPFQPFRIDDAGLGEDKGASVPRWPRCES